MTQPSGLKNLLRAAAGALPFVPRGDSLPDRTLTVEDLEIDPANVAAWPTLFFNWLEVNGFLAKGKPKP